MKTIRVDYSEEYQVEEESRVSKSTGMKRRTPGRTPDEENRTSSRQGEDSWARFWKWLILGFAHEKDPSRITDKGTEPNNQQKNSRLDSKLQRIDA
jgi:hypothetical protein